MTPTRTIRGFTLVEIIVSVGLFALVMLVVTTAYYNLIALDRRARATNEVVNNVSFAVDAMTRGIRTGSGYQCLNGSYDAAGNSTDGSCTCFAYLDSNIGTNVPVSYYLDTSTHIIKRVVGSAACSGGSSITDPAVNISLLSFYVRGSGVSDNLEPQALFTIKGTMPADNTGAPSTFIIEENASQRLLDI